MSQFGDLTFRPWNSFVDSQEFAVPRGSEVSERIQTNLRYYKANYLAVIGVIIALTSYVTLRVLVSNNLFTDI